MAGRGGARDHNRLFDVHSYQGGAAAAVALFPADIRHCCKAHAQDGVRLASDWCQTGMCIREALQCMIFGSNCQMSAQETDTNRWQYYKCSLYYEVLAYNIEM